MKHPICLWLFLSLLTEPVCVLLIFFYSLWIRHNNQLAFMNREIKLFDFILQFTMFDYPICDVVIFMIFWLSYMASYSNLTLFLKYRLVVFNSLYVTFLTDVQWKNLIWNKFLQKKNMNCSRTAVWQFISIMFNYILIYYGIQLIKNLLHSIIMVIFSCWLN